MDFDETKRSVCCGCCLLAVASIGMLFYMSYSSLDASEYGLDYSSITKTIAKDEFGSGYHFLGFGHSFIRYPSTV